MVAWLLTLQNVNKPKRASFSPQLPGLAGYFFAYRLNKMDKYQNKFYTRALDSTKIDLFQLFLGFEPLHCGYLVQ